MLCFNLEMLQLQFMSYILLFWLNISILLYISCLTGRKRASLSTHPGHKLLKKIYLFCFVFVFATVPLNNVKTVCKLNKCTHFKYIKHIKYNKDGPFHLTNIASDRMKKVCNFYLYSRNQEHIQNIELLLRHITWDWLSVVYRGETSLEKTPYFQKIYKN